MFRLKCLVATSVLALTIGSVNAATVTDDVTFSATSFTGGPPPSYTGGTSVDPVTGSFTITFDPTQTYLDSTGITLNTQNISLASPLVFDYSPSAYAPFAAGELVVGGSSAGAANVLLESGNADFYLQILTFTTTPTFQQLGYVTEGGSYFYSALGTGAGSSVTVTPGVSATPLPAALPLFATGLGALGLLGWRRKRKLATKTAALAAA
jgi:hypothetical protein